MENIRPIKNNKNVKDQSAGKTDMRDKVTNNNFT